MGVDHKKKWIMYLSVYGLFFVFHLFLSFTSETPLIYADEAGYIGNARKLFFAQAEESFYYPGYGLLIFPAFLISNKIEIAYQIIQVINSLMMAFIPVLSVKLIKYIDKDFSTKTALTIAIVSSLYPAFLLYSNFAMTEAAIIPGFLLMALAIAKLLNNHHDKRIWLICLLVGVYLVLIHPRNIVVFPALFIVLIMRFFIINKNKFSRRKKRVIWLTLISLVVLLGIIAFYTALNIDYGTNFSSKVIGIFSIKGIKNIALSLLGQSFYLLLSTLGLGLTGLLFAINLFFKNISSNNPIQKNLALFVGFLVLSFLFELVLSSWFMSMPRRADHVIYGRYNEGYLLPIMILGMFYYMKSFNIRLRARFLLTAHLLIVFVSFVFLKDILENQTINWMNVFGIYLYNIINNELNLLLLIVTYSLIAFLVLWLGIRKKKGLFISVIVLVFASTVSYAGYDYFYKSSKARIQEKALVDVLRIYQELNPQDKYINIYYDRGAGLGWHYYNYVTYIPEINMIRYTHQNELSLDPKKADLVITNLSDFDLHYQGARLLAIENHHPFYLWILPGKNQEYFEQQGYIAVEGFPKTLPEGSYSSRIELTKNIIRTNRKIEFPLRIVHTGSDSFWPNTFALRNPLHSVRVGAILYKDFEKVREYRADLPKIIYPGEQIDISFDLDINELKNLILNANGEYLLRIGLVHEGVTWFFSKGDNTIDIKIDREFLE